MRLHSEHGSLPLSTVMAPAIEYAEHGFRITAGESRMLAGGAAQATEFPATRAIYLKPDGSSYGSGELLVQKDYAKTLRAIRDGGHDAFYRGAIAERMAQDLAANGSAVRLQAFHDYEAVDARIVRGSYRGYELVGLDVPAAGSVSIQALHVMERFDPDSMDDEEWAAIIGQKESLQHTMVNKGQLMYLSKRVGRNEVNLFVHSFDSNILTDLLINHLGGIKEVSDISIYQLFRPRFFPLPKDNSDMKHCIIDIKVMPQNLTEVYKKLLNPNVPVDLETIVHKAVQKNPADRYATAQDLADDLQRFLDGD